jgi:hypothetical protein
MRITERWRKLYSRRWIQRWKSPLRASRFNFVNPRSHSQINYVSHHLRNCSYGSPLASFRWKIFIRLVWISLSERPRSHGMFRMPITSQDSPPRRLLRALSHAHPRDIRFARSSKRQWRVRASRKSEKIRIIEPRCLVSESCIRSWRCTKETARGRAGG